MNFGPPEEARRIIAEIEAKHGRMLWLFNWRHVPKEQWPEYFQTYDGATAYGLSSADTYRAFAAFAKKNFPGKIRTLYLKENSTVPFMVALDTGSHRGGEWQPGQRLNGDETAHGTGVLLSEKLQLCRFRLFDPGAGVAVTEQPLTIGAP